MRKRIPKRPPNPRFKLIGNFIHMKCSYEGQRMSIGTGIYIDTGDWDAKRERPKSQLRGRLDLVKVNDKLTEWQNAISKVYRNLGKTATLEEFKQEFRYEVGIEDRPGSPQKELIPYILDYVETYKKRPGVTRTSWGKFAALAVHLQQFADDTDTAVDFDTVTWDLRDSLIAWMYMPPREFAINNAQKYLGSLKTIMQDAYRRGLHENVIFKEKGFTIRRVRTKNKVRLTVDELYRIEHYDLDGLPELAKVRDLMIFASWTGLRVSDWHKVKRRNIREIKGAAYIELATTKTKTKVLIPLVKPVAKILDRYDYQLPDVVEQTFNRLIKKVCKLAIPDSYFTRIYSEGGMKKEEQALKCDFVSSHAGRRSFASNAYQKTGSAYPIMKITGHESEATFFKYIDLKTEQVVQLLHEPLNELANWQPK